MTNNTANDRLLTLLGCTLATWLSLIPTVSAKPNVVFILADDLGWSDTTLYGTTSFYKTPNIKRLAARGMTFTRAYSDSPLCSPTRASILTGLSPARHGITTPNCHLPIVTLAATATPSGPANQKATIPKPVTRLKTDYYTIAEMFKDNGYATGHFGKWHLGAEPYSPLEHGFNVDVPHHPGPGPAGSYVAPWKFKDFDHDPDVPDQHLEDRMAKEAVAFLQQHKDEPFFLNYWMFSVHAPFDAKQSLIDKYRKQVDPNDPQRSPTYAAMIESMDDAVGTLLDTLDRLGIADNTIIVFASDNGGNMYNEVDGTSATSNAPLRGGKATMYEGGVRGPAIVVYPGHVKAGSRSDARIQTSDYYPTLLELLEINAQPEQTFDGISITAALDGKSLDREAIFTYFPHSPRIPEWLPPAVSVHAGDWKLIRVFFGGDGGKHDYKLFHLREDIGERNNLAKVHPERVRRLDAMIDEFLKDTGAVLPLPNPRFDPAKYDPNQIGKAALKGTGTNQKKPRRNVKPVAGWKPGGTCELTLEQGALIVTSVGGDPYLSFTLPDPVKEKSLMLKFSLASRAGGHGQIFWQEQGVAPPFLADRSKHFDVHHDGEAHEYSISWTADNPVLAIRIDPATAKGRARLSNIRLTTDDGEEVYRWKF
ncbi:Arylsulfatase [Stieleria neptunia]|uniref:Arylsulfatase n=1 Tax=Stieleria neptunia TaxID=2527979 RepID=A0A518HTA4_9BACT|nr:sulfatase [Stieleria neptunia]QDV44054.1 Arylsulfatase [Stieleria neptunia]